MREIKFRGKRIDSGEWVYGSLVKEDWSKLNKKDLYCIVVDTCFQDSDYPEQTDLAAKAYAVIQETIGQFTGRKDEKENEIYEGDILNFAYLGRCENEIGYVRYVDCAFVVVTNHEIQTGDSVYQKELILLQPGYEKFVIGNIFENPELLKS